jgi:hypothetical protein
VAARVVERIPPLSVPLDNVDTSASNESCRRLGNIAACPMKTKAACVVRTASMQAGSPTAGATLVGTPNCVARPSVDEVNPPPGLPMGNPPTRSDLVRQIERAIMLPGEQTRLCIRGKRAKGNRSLVDARRNHRKNLMRRTSERKNKKKYLPNHVQILRLFAKVLPLQHIAAFGSSFMKLGGLSNDSDNPADAFENKGDLGNPFDSCPRKNKASTRCPGTLSEPPTGATGSSCPGDKEVICHTPLAWVDVRHLATSMCVFSAVVRVLNLCDPDHTTALAKIRMHQFVSTPREMMRRQILSSNSLQWIVFWREFCRLSPVMTMMVLHKNTVMLLMFLQKNPNFF